MHRRIKAAAAFALGLMAITPIAACSQQHTVAGKTSADVFPVPATRALADAACKGDADAVRRLVAEGVEPNGRGLDDTTILMWAMSCENQSGLEALLSSGADPDLGAEGYFPVSLAATFRKPDVLSLLLKHGGNPNLPPRDTMPENWRRIDTPLWHALGASMDHANTENLKLLLEAGADVNQGSTGGDSPSVVRLAVGFNRPEEALLMIGYGYRGDLNELQVAARRSLENPSLMESVKPRLRSFIDRLEEMKRR